MNCTDCHGPVKPVVALDIDGTLGPYHERFWRFACDWLGVELNPEPYGYDVEFSDHLGLDKPTYRRIKLAYRQGGQKRLMGAYPGAVTLAHVLRYRAGVELWLTTTRPWERYDAIDPDTREWIRRNGIEHDYLLFDDRKYERLVERVGLERIVCVFDDEPEQCRRAEALGIPYLQHVTTHAVAARLPVHTYTLDRATRTLLEAVQKWQQENSKERATA